MGEARQVELARQVVVVGRPGIEMIGTVVEVRSVELPGVETTTGSMLEMVGKQLEMVGKQLEQLEMGKKQVGRAHPCQSSSCSRARTCGRQLWAMDGWTWTRHGRSH